MDRKNTGFTLLELMVTIAVLVVILGIGAPALSTLASRVRAANTQHLLSGAFATARIEAIRRNVAVAVCPSADGTSCTGTTVWDGGWIVFVDRSRDGQPARAADVLQAFDAPGGGLRLRATSGRRLVRFRPNGWSAGSNVTMSLCGTTAQGGLLGTVVVNNSGRARSDRPAGEARCPY